VLVPLEFKPRQKVWLSCMVNLFFLKWRPVKKESEQQTMDMRVLGPTGHNSLD